MYNGASGHQMVRQVEEDKKKKNRKNLVLLAEPSEQVGRTDGNLMSFVVCFGSIGDGTEGLMMSKQSMMTDGDVMIKGGAALLVVFF